VPRAAVRQWGFWTEHKLDILSSYLDAFTPAAKNKAGGTTAYLDLFAGQAENEARQSGRRIDGSPTRALRTQPALSTLVLFEMPGRAEALLAKLRADFPGRDIRMQPGSPSEPPRPAGR
jgi:three-Cys-motif partner protein